MRIFQTSIAAAILIAAAAPSVQAGTMRFRTPTQLKGACISAGGSFSAPDTGGVYSCRLRDGAVIACGGRGDFAKTCESGMPRSILNPVLVRSGTHDETSRIEPATY